ncbi:Proteasomal ubiquitin receptor ADRM1-like [Hondaea fermentalgiana]|uniref:Proteasomal ubiquitin receptor ADRM1-like n=1 Tax=Hondaea fermentalgiana TaxID=2315210 RepID=A0A2R5GAZ9_9STRA|nr:Proteasomal ubiquitin receptor ADRM1-like [Hondaea fermentalgiana]|eukprot:GBG24864.1 Proteasomal ubiquitin receptor ADRM1-like [Hondaea fermentalgiana]
MASVTLFEFKAGMLNATEKRGAEGVWKVEADPRKGQLCLTRGNEGAIHLVWKLRPSGQVEEDLLVFPESQTFTKVNTGRRDDRVYLLQFNNSRRRNFFWMQGKKEDDEDNARKLNEYMSNPPAAPVGSLGGAGGTASGAPDQHAMMQLLSQFGAGGGNGRQQLDESQLQSVLQGFGMTGGSGSAPAAPAPPAASTTAASTSGASTDAPAASGTQQQFTAEDLQRALAGVSGAMQQQRTPPLNEIYRASELLPMLEDPAIRDELMQFLPEDRQTDQELRYSLSSPQVRQAFAMLSHALQSDNFNSVMTNFGLDPMAGAAELQRGDGIGAFLRALQAKADEESDLYD